MATFNEISSGGIVLSGLSKATPYFESSLGGILVLGTIGRHFSYEGSGGVDVFRCADVTKTTIFVTKYGPGDIAFSEFAARNGILEKICIKTVSLNCIPRNCAVAGAGCFPLYKDKFNSVWLDDNLLTQSEAIVIVQAYIDRKKAEEEALLRNC